MPSYTSNTLYITLLGRWNEAAIEAVSSKADQVANDLGADGIGQNMLRQDGAFAAYDISRPQAIQIALLMEILKSGPAWLLTVDYDDETHLEHYAAGPGIEDTVTFNGPITDPLVSLSRIEDYSHICALQAARNNSATMGFEVVAQAPAD